MPADHGGKVILYELNEVPWSVVDAYVGTHPRSNLAQLLPRAQLLTTQIDDPVPLQPWRTWPSFHTGLLATDHNSFDLGQDPATFRGTTLWDAVEEAGLPFGLFGVMQSWPARVPRHGGFWVPDTFARDAECVPPTINRFQAFNLEATSENSFSPDAPLRTRALAGVGYDLVRRGLTPRSAWELGGQLRRERANPKSRAGRSIFQAIPCFDLYWRLHRRYRPDLSIFFTNHVAGMMHRYWGDAMEGYEQVDPGYAPDPVYRTLIGRAMDVVDGHLGRIRHYVDRDPGTVLMVAGSMGQAAVPRRLSGTQLVLAEPGRLLAALEAGPVGLGSAMFPQISLLLPEGASQPDGGVDLVADALRSVILENGQPIFGSFRRTGRSLQFAVELDLSITPGTAPPTVHFTAVGASQPATAPAAALGLSVRTRPGGDNTGHHIPDGILITYGDGVAPDASRVGVDLLDVAPSILANHLGVAPPATMKGRPSLFAPGTGNQARAQPS